MNIALPDDLASVRIILYALRRGQRAYGKETNGFEVCRNFADQLELKLLAEEQHDRNGVRTPRH